VRPLFLIGTGRCGSTLIHRLLGHHPDIGFVSILDERLPPFRRLNGRLNGPAYRASGSASRATGGRLPFVELARRAFTPAEAYGLLTESVSPLIAAPLRDLTAEDASPWISGRLRSLVEERAKAQRAPVFMHKLTGWPRMSFLRTVFPEARFVYIVRDGRAVANSLLQVEWWHGALGPTGWTFGPLPEAYAAEWEESGRSFAVLAGIEWKILLDAYDAACRVVPAEARMEVRYEDFVRSPREHLEQIVSFAGLEWCGPLERALVSEPVHAGRSDAYRRELSAEDVRRVDWTLRTHLDRYGYAPNR
jgi:sulfotransferase family protein